MKKTIALALICLLVIMSLTACENSNTNELVELRQQIEALESKVAELKNSEAMDLQEKTQPLAEVPATETHLLSAVSQRCTSSGYPILAQMVSDRLQQMS